MPWYYACFPFLLPVIWTIFASTNATFFCLQWRIISCRREAATICPRRWPFDLESGVRVMCDVSYLCANFGLPRPLCSRLRPDVRDRQTDVSQHHRLMPPARGWGTMKQELLFYQSDTLNCNTGILFQPHIWYVLPSVLRHCWLGNRNGTRRVKMLGHVMLVVTIWLESCTFYSCHCHHHLFHPQLQ